MAHGWRLGPKQHGMAMGRWMRSRRSTVVPYFQPDPAGKKVRPRWVLCTSMDTRTCLCRNEVHPLTVGRSASGSAVVRRPTGRHLPHADRRPPSRTARFPSRCETLHGSGNSIRRDAAQGPSAWTERRTNPRQCTTDRSSNQKEVRLIIRSRPSIAILNHPLTTAIES